LRIPSETARVYGGAGDLIALATKALIVFIYG
jgi:hypothetical protein